MIDTNETRADYHDGARDEVAALSASIAHVLLTQSPLHAWIAHPRLNPNYERTEDEKFDIGNVAHELILEGTTRAVRLDFADWRTNTARTARDEAREAGLIPLKAEQYERTLEMVGAVRAQLVLHRADPPLLQDGAPETTLRWDENGVECKARIDWLRDDRSAIDDLKTTSSSANPYAYARNLYNLGGDIQAAMYVRAVEQLYGVVPRFRWIVVETAPPYALSVIEPGADVLAVGADKVATALRLWARLLEEDEWPGYPRDVVTAELPPWEESKWLERREAME